MPFTPATKIIESNKPSTGFTSASDVLIEKYKAEAAKPKGLKGLLTQANKNQSEAAAQIGGDIKEAFKGSIQKGVEGYEELQNPNLTPGGAFKGAVKLGSGVVGALASPLAPVMKPVGKGLEKVSDKISDIPAVQEFSQTPAGEAVEKGAEVVRDVTDVAGAMAGFRGAPSIATKASNISRIVGTEVVDTVDKIKNPLTKSPVQIAEKQLKQAIDDVMPVQNKKIRTAELRQSFPESTTGTGGVVRKGTFGKPTPLADEKLIEVARTAQPYLKGITDPLKKIQNVNKGIVETSKQTNSFLDTNPTRVNFQDMSQYMQRNKPSYSLSKDPGATEAYSRATDSALNTLANELKTSPSPIVSGAEIRNARIKIDQEITRQLGETTFDSPQYKGIKAAEVDTRNMLNRMNEDLVRYPDQLSKLNRMNEFIDTAKARGIEVDMENPAVRMQIEDKFGLQSTPDSVANAKKLSDSHKTMTNLYTARDNMIDNFQSNVGKGNKVVEWARRNPVKAKALGILATAVGGHWVLSSIGD